MLHTCCIYPEDGPPYDAVAAVECKEVGFGSSRSDESKSGVTAAVTAPRKGTVAACERASRLSACLSEA